MNEETIDVYSCTTLGLVSLTGCVGTPVVYGPAMDAGDFSGR